MTAEIAMCPRCPCCSIRNGECVGECSADGVHPHPSPAEPSAEQLTEIWAKQWADTQARNIALEFENIALRNAVAVAIAHISGKPTRFSEREPVAVLYQLRAALDTHDMLAARQREEAHP